MFLGILGIANKSSVGAVSRSSWEDCGPWGGVRRRVVGLRYIPTRLRLAASIYRVR